MMRSILMMRASCLSTILPSRNAYVASEAIAMIAARVVSDGIRRRIAPLIVSLQMRQILRVLGHGPYPRVRTAFAPA